jgi:hypothetical protein
MITRSTLGLSGFGVSGETRPRRGSAILGDVPPSGQQLVMMMDRVFAKTLVRAREIKSFEVTPARSVGWEVSVRSDHDVVQRQYSDWHRVERALTRFTREISELRRQGWVDA